MRLLYGADEAVAGFVGLLLGAEFSEGRGIGIIDGKGRMVAGVLFHDWWPDTGVVEVTIAATDPRWMNRRILRSLGGYAFGFAQMVLARTSAENTRARSLWKRLGGHEVIIPRLWGENEDGAILTLTREQWLERAMT